MITIIYVTSLDKTQVEPLNNIYDFKWEQALENGELSISFSCLKQNNPAFDILTNKAVITVDDYEFSVEQSQTNAYSKQINAVSLFFTHSATWKSGYLNNMQTIENRLNFVLGGTGWTYVVDLAIATRTVSIEPFGESNVVDLINLLCEQYQVEFCIMPNRTLYFAESIGEDNDKIFRYKHNLSDVVLVEDTSKLRTFIRGEGAENMTVSYTSPNAAVFGILEAEPIKDERFTIESNLIAYIRSKLEDVPELAIQSTTDDMTNRSIGEKVWFIYEPLNIEMQTRILNLTKTFVNGELTTTSVIFGNKMPKDIVQQIVETQSDVQRIDSAVSTTQTSTEDAINAVNTLASNTNSALLTLQNQIANRVILDEVIQAINESVETLKIVATRINFVNAALNNVQITTTHNAKLGKTLTLGEGTTGDKTLILADNVKLKGVNDTQGVMTLEAEDKVILNSPVIDFTNVTDVPGLRTLLGLP